MTSYVNQAVNLFRSYRSFLKLSASWVLGVVLGAIFAINNASPVRLIVASVSLERGALWLQLVLRLFFICAVVIISIFRIPTLLELTGGFRAMIFSFCAVSIYCTFGSAGWLVCGLMMFSGIGSLAPLFWFIWRRLDRGRGGLRRDLAYVSLTIIVVTLLDFFYFSPILSFAIGHI